MVSQLRPATAWRCGPAHLGVLAPGQKISRACRQAGDIVRPGEDNAILPGGDEFRGAVGHGGDHRGAAGQGLQDHVAARVVEGGQGQHRGGLIKRRGFGTGPQNLTRSATPSPLAACR